MKQRMEQGERQTISVARVRSLFCGPAATCLPVIARDWPEGIYLAGGTVRDLLLERAPVDIDLTVSCHARARARAFATCCGGTLVELGREEDAARVVAGPLTVDFSSFRLGAATIEEELTKRDLTINALAVRIDDLCGGEAAGAPETELPVLDPTGGLRDLFANRIRLCSPRAVTEDPLRLLRVFRFAARLEFAVEAATLETVRRRADTIYRVAAERIGHELDLIMASDRAARTIREMAEHRILFELFPELEAGCGMEQPASHHLDVFGHLVETLTQAERIGRDPGRFFAGFEDAFDRWLAENGHRILLKWAALLHDVGKPLTFGINEDKGGRITFYNHDLQGAGAVRQIASRLRWSRAGTDLVASLVAAHMRPFFLANDQRRGRLTVKACLRLLRLAGDWLPGLFLLAMADGLAGKGEKSPLHIEQELVELYRRLMQVWKEHMQPVVSRPPLVTGRDLIEELGLEPGPLFRIILSAIEEARMEQTITGRHEALALARRIAASRDAAGLADASRQAGTGEDNA